MSEKEVKNVVEFIKKQNLEKREDGLEEDIIEKDKDEVRTSYAGMTGKLDLDAAMESQVDPDKDELFEEVKKTVIKAGKRRHHFCSANFESVIRAQPA